MENPVLSIACRSVHLISMATLFGATIFMRWSLLPVLQQQQGVAAEIHEAVRRRWSRFVHASIALIIATGAFNFFMRLSEVKAMPYHPLFTVKFMLAMVVFFFASALVGRSKGLQPIRDKAEMYLTINVVLSLIVIGIAGVMRVAPLKENQSPAAEVRPVATSNSESSGTSIAAIANP